ncbi:MAG: crossover junction endodeoxyribonuclease RuvC [Bdellovibrionia bacterium]
MAGPIIIIGIDPGSRVAGYGLVRLGAHSDPEYVEHGVLALPADAPLPVRLVSLKTQLQNVLNRFNPAVAVIENIFMGKNADSAFKLGHARGVCMAEAAGVGCEIVEYATRQVKKGVTGNGGATKEQVGMLVSASLKISRSKVLPEDATDALALAYYHALSMQVAMKMRGRGKERGLTT